MPVLKLEGFVTALWNSPCFPCGHCQALFWKSTCLSLAWSWVRGRERGCVGRGDPGWSPLQDSEGLVSLSRSPGGAQLRRSAESSEIFFFKIYFHPKVLTETILLSFRQHVGAQAGRFARWVLLLLFCFSGIYCVPLWMTLAKSDLKEPGGMFQMR